jgi:release factor glutamine methyltransferase
MRRRARRAAGISVPPPVQKPAAIGEVVQWAEGVLGEAGIEAAAFEAKVLVGHVLGIKPSQVAGRRKALSAEAADVVRPLVERRSRREPLQYVTGDTEFLGLRLKCRPGVFIPRPETELLVEAVVERLSHGREEPRVADVGCGTGAIAIGLATSLPRAQVWATDVSAAAVELARENAEALGVPGRVTFMTGSFTEPLRRAGVLQTLDALVCNPPYVPSDQIDALEPEVARHEPREALDGGPDGLRFYRRLIGDLAPVRGLIVALEVGVGQAEAVRGMLAELLWMEEVRVIRDYAGIERIVVGG